LDLVFSSDSPLVWKAEKQYAALKENEQVAREKSGAAVIAEA
jgi:hypothetical protein